jgi:hypothetical protein
MMLPQSVPGVLRDKFGGMSAMRDEIRPSRYCCASNSACTQGLYWDPHNDCTGGWGCNDCHCEGTC